MTERDLKWRLSMEGVQESLRSMDSLEKRVKALEGATKAQTVAVKSATQATTAFDVSSVSLGRNVGGAATQLGKMRGVLAMALPSVGQFAGALGGVGTAISAVTSGFGPLGLVIGAAAVPIAKIVSLLQEADRELKNVARSSIAAKQSLEDMIGALRAQSTAQTRRETVELGGGDIMDQLGLVRSREQDVQSADLRRLRALDRMQELSAGRQSRESLAEMSRVRAEYEQAVRELPALRQRVQEARDMLGNVRELQAEDVVAEAAEANAPPTRPRRSGGGGRRAAAEEPDDFGAMIAGLASPNVGTAEESFRLAMLEEEQRLFEANADKETEISRELHRMREEQHRAEMQWKADNAADVERDANAERLRIRAIQDEWEDSLLEVASNLEAVYSLAVNGEMSLIDAIKQTGRAWLQRFAFEQGKMAASQIAMAIGNPLAAPAHLASAAKHAALAVGAGIGGAVIPASSGGGGGAASGERRAGRVLGSGVREERGSSNTYVINVSTFAVGTKADVGREIRAALREAARHDGAAI